jgi:hypothetical protein
VHESIQKARHSRPSSAPSVGWLNGDPKFIEGKGCFAYVQSKQLWDETIYYYNHMVKCYFYTQVSGLNCTKHSDASAKILKQLQL